MDSTMTAGGEIETRDHVGDMRDVWAALSSPVWRVLDDEGVNMSDAAIRHLHGQHWLYSDAVDGFKILHEADLAYLILDRADEE